MTSKMKRRQSKEVVIFSYQNQDYPLDDRSAWPESVLALNPDPQAEFVKVLEGGDWLSLWDRAGYKVAYAYETTHDASISLGVLGTDRHAASFVNQNCATLEAAEELLRWALGNNKPSTEWEQWDRTHRYKVASE